MDYILTDEWTCPPGREKQYTETAVRLPFGYLVYQPPFAAPGITPLPAHHNKFVTFGLFQRTLKMNSGVWDAIAEVIRRSPDSVLLIQNPDPAFDDIQSAARRELVREFTSRGIAPDHLRLFGPRPHRQFMAVIAQADVALDTFPFQGQTTTCECLWMGVPVITLAGEAHVARVGSAIMQRVGLEQLVATSREEYVDIAARLAGDFTALGSLRASMRGRLQRSSLLDGAGLTRSVERAYRWMWKKWCSN